jgi:hypothetical protein
MALGEVLLVADRLPERPPCLLLRTAFQVEPSWLPRAVDHHPVI